MSKLVSIAVACAAFVSCAAAHTAGGGLVARSGVAIHGEHGSLAGQRHVFADGQGNATGTAGSGFTNAAGGEGLRRRSFSRSADGSLRASGNASAERNASFTHSAEEGSSGERSTTITRADTGVTFGSSTSFGKGSGLSRSASCKDAAGNTVDCVSR